MRMSSTITCREKTPVHPSTFFTLTFNTSPGNVEGCLGWAHWNDRKERYEITTPQLQCWTVVGTLYNPLCDPPEFEMLATNLESRMRGYYSYRVVEFLPDIAQGLKARLSFENPEKRIGIVGKRVRLDAYKQDERDTTLTWELVAIGRIIYRSYFPLKCRWRLAFSHGAYFAFRSADDCPCRHPGGIFDCSVRQEGDAWRRPKRSAFESAIDRTAIYYECYLHIKYSLIEKMENRKTRNSKTTVIDQANHGHVDRI